MVFFRSFKVPCSGMFSLYFSERKYVSGVLCFQKWAWRIGEAGRVKWVMRANFPRPPWAEGAQSNFPVVSCTFYGGSGRKIDLTDEGDRWHCLQITCSPLVTDQFLPPSCFISRLQLHKNRAQKSSPGCSWNRTGLPWGFLVKGTVPVKAYDMSMLE